MSSKTTSPPNMSIADTATYLGVTTRTVESMIRDQRLPAYRIGRTVRLRQVDIDNALRPYGGVA
jgi:excisionase family DNA binding protein